MCVNIALAGDLLNIVMACDIETISVTKYYNVSWHLLCKRDGFLELRIFFDGKMLKI